MRVMVAFGPTSGGPLLSGDEDGNATPDGLRMPVNPCDEVALEQALRWRETGLAREILAVSCGSVASQDQLRTALAMGADRALLVAAGAALEPLLMAKLLKAVAQRENVSLVLLGARASDGEARQIPQMLAAMLGWPQATDASGLRLEAPGVCVRRELDHSHEWLGLTLPAVVGVDPMLVRPRSADLCSGKPIIFESAEALAADLSPRLLRLALAKAPQRKPGARVDSARTLVDRLQAEGLLSVQEDTR
ncbi:MAG: hypothetical protein CGU28_05185 [Candidatus Dactylopiibacterium carminicum]|uniref:Electron transfer flavoprotein alpha/beta-subunit N-terminal domain-containing protein n=1 Tax=Candidatus Dactylopiibacterium carminicum TaxID=857335 RepID=A0A272ETY3_9RHOO|nr:hypothetical protein [Candidatus Dactylopiibacterium carminicum]KAF7599675.1 hypothetical protein BGI27_06815 [Candidatus Dactylopiibacterium carminicum]PAS93547.1 MAG: hypothetical protein CGU29_07010 [Candidatus Dactylopiibacterium carminicum]PAS97460.1 MAG: hypothetical protein CGU28_05185 [Candidatus Dactylopiibacterium carminicum]PAS99673.1 MAG: hypothetical protein BSR46_06850 [Candidatus Dactylopiibacterium carminicum]